MSEIADRYRRLADAFTAKVAAVPDDGWDVPTPCEDWTARDLVGHVVEAADAQERLLAFLGRDPR
ncbi:MAG TPA: maleylpyruvate isomerase N-terminal domain-containing protein [Acidimicrobiales bacterium]|nr:maleylpyruvate isomerase N-terminal domain-containing protein [Acidimicrobiales bacterium]